MRCKLPLVELVVTEYYVRNGSIFGYSAIQAIPGCVICDCEIYAISSSVIWYCVTRAV